MHGLSSLRIGCVQYLNALPLIHGWPGPLVRDHPARLCQALAAGDVDVALVSSFEYLRHPIYTIVRGVSVASAGPVYSVVLVHDGALTEIAEVELDPASLTSVHLLRCLLAENGLSPRLTGGAIANTLPPTATRARLLIGDRAIKFRQEFGARYHYWDLGEQWSLQTDLPFVYALWLMRPEVACGAEVADALRALRDRNLAHLDDLLAAQKETDRVFARKYFCQHLQFGFGPLEEQGLLKFRSLCQKHAILPPGAPPLRMA